MDSKGHIYCDTDKATHSNQGTGGVPLGTATSSWPWQQTTCQKEGVGVVTILFHIPTFNNVI